MPTLDDKLVPLTKAAAQLGMHPQTLRNRINDKTIPAIRTPTNRLLVQQAWIDQHIEGLTTPLVCSKCQSEVNPGRYTKYLPEALIEPATQAMDDDDYLSIRQEIGIIQGRISELLNRLKGNPGEPGIGALWKELSQCLVGYRTALRRSNVAAAAKHIEDAEAIVERGKQDYQIWDELRRQITLVTKMRSTEHTRLVANQEMMTQAQGQNLISGILSSIQHVIEDNVADEDLKAAIYDAFYERIDKSLGAAAS